jgi:hypothetical protein
MAPHPRALRRLAAVAAIAWATVGCKARHDSAAAADAAATDAAHAADGAAAQDGGGGRSAEAPTPAPADDLLPVATDGLSVRARHLLEAIAGDDAALATDILFPRDGWTSTRDAADPGKDWERVVAAPFRRGIHGMSRRHQNLARAQSVTLELGTAIAQVTPRSHAWKKAVWIAHGSHLVFVLDGRTRTLPVRELVAWRGEWYVTRLR